MGYRISGARNIGSGFQASVTSDTGFQAPVTSDTEFQAPVTMDALDVNKSQKEMAYEQVSNGNRTQVSERNRT